MPIATPRPQRVERSERVSSGRRQHWPLLVVVVLGLLSLAIYTFALTVPYSLARYADRPLLDMAKISGSYSPADGARFTLTFTALWGAYLISGGLAPRIVRRHLRPVAYGGAILFALALLLLYPITAADIYNYVLYGLVQHRGANPLTAMPIDVIGPPLIDYSAWPWHPSPYGPIWQWLAFGVTALTRDWLLGGILAFKVILMGCHLLNMGLVERLAAHTGSSRPAVAALLYGWNPLILYEVIGNGHNDIVMLTAMLLALVAFARAGVGRVLALPLAVGGVLAKFVAVLWLPPLAWALWIAPPHRDRRRRMLLAGAGCLFLIVGGYWMFWSGAETFVGVRRQSDLYTTSFGGLAMIMLVERRQLLEGRVLLDMLKGVTFVVLAVTLFLRRPRSGTVHELLASCFDLTVVYLFVGALWFQPWYVVPLFGFAPLLDVRRRAIAVAYAFGGIASYVVYFYVWAALDWTPDRLLLQNLATWAAHGPALLVLTTIAVARLQRLREEWRVRLSRAATPSDVDGGVSVG